MQDNFQEDQIKMNNNSSTRFILHVGTGLEAYSKGEAPLVAIDKLKTMMNGAFRDISTLPRNKFMVGPEFLRNETEAAKNVMAAFLCAYKEKDTTLCVATFSSGLATALVNAMVDCNLHHELVVCLHADAANEGYTSHRLSKEGYLQDWPFGVLTPSLERDELKEQFADVLKAA